MSRLTVMPRATTDTKIGDALDGFVRRVATTPTGMCPVALQLTMVQTSAAQTCGKCIPCRDGLPQLARLLEKVVACQADASALDEARTLATWIRDASDCAIGYEAARAFLEGLDTFADEYASHVGARACRQDVAQKVPCEAMCPAHVNAPGYIALVREGDYAGAVNMVRKDNPFPTACALVCEHPCERRCRRALIDAPINIRGIKKFAVDQVSADKVATPPRLPDTGRRIAVVGAGCAGLTCAYFLALMGHKVEVFEAQEKLGGMLRYGIPAYRFPRARLDEDVNGILSVGNIEVHTGVTVDAAKMAELDRDFDAVFVGIGAHAGKGLRLEGVNAEGVIPAVEMLREIGYDRYPDFSGKRVAVIGGGNVAMDCCRTAVRAGADEVTCIYRRRLEDMTALPEEVEAAIAEGVEMMTLAAPASIEVDEGGHCAAVIVQPQMIGPVKRGRPAPLDANKPPVRVPVDVVLIAVGQDIVSGPFEEFGMKADRGLFRADPELRAEGFEKVFVGGDCQSGPGSAIMAIGAGKVAARNIDEYLGYHHKLDCGVEVPAPRPNDPTPTGRVNVAERPVRERRGDFAAVEIEMTPEEAAQECGRCLRCDHYGCGVLVGGRTQYV